MKLTHRNGLYYALCPYAEKDLAKKAGFRWDAASKSWTSKDYFAAVKLRDYADAAGLSALKADKESLDAAQDASRAASSTFCPPSPPGLDYLPYQKAGIEYALSRSGVLVGDQMGLGKTIQAIGVLNVLIERGERLKILVICPASLKRNWLQEIDKWLIKTCSMTIHEGKSCKPVVWHVGEAADIHIVNYDILGGLTDPEWDVIIVDESHKLKNPKTARFKAFKKLHAKRRIALTGTPIPNRPSEIFSTLNWLDPKEWGSWWNFVHRYCNAQQGRFGMDVSGSSNLGELQMRLRSTLMVRRIKTEVLKELPPKFRQVIEVPADALSADVAREWSAYKNIEATLTKLRVATELAKASENESVYRKCVEELKAGASAAFSELARARVELATKKIPLVIAHLSDCEDPVVFFAHHRVMIDAVVSHFKTPCVITGSTPNHLRQQAVDRFQQGGHNLFVGNMLAAGVGLTLTRSSHVVFGELDWVPANISQAEDRCLTKNNLVFCPRTVYDDRMSIKNIDKIQIGDAVLTHTGKTKTVTATHSKEHRGLITSIKYTGWNHPIECTHDHKLLVTTDKGKTIEWMEAHKVLPGYDLVFPRPQSSVELKSVLFKPEWRRYDEKPTTCIVEGCHEKIEARLMCRIHYREMLKTTPTIDRPKVGQHTNSRYVRMPDEIKIDDAWLFLFGWFAAEGFSSISDNKADFVSLSGHEKEINILEKCGKVFERLGVKYTIYRNKKTKAIELRAYSTELARWFRSWFGHTAAKKSLPDEIMNLPEHQAKVVLDAYILGDGYIRRNIHEWVSASQKMAMQFCMLAVKCGYSPTLRRGSKKSGSHWVCGYSVTKRTNMPFVLHKVNKITTSREKVRVYDITVDEDHSFATGFCIAHNCHRIGQLDNVLVQHIVVEGSLDAVMARKVIDKQGIIDKALDAVPDNGICLDTLSPVSASDYATETVTRDYVKRVSKTIPAQVIPLAHLGVQMVAAFCNHASTFDGVGFSKVDAEIGHSLASQGSLSPKQAVIALRLCKKYKRQLGEDMVKKIEEAMKGN